MSENSHLRIHAQLKPGTEVPGSENSGKTTPIRITAENTSAHHLRRRRRGRRRLSAGDRLMRNSAISCAVLLAVLALGNVEAPWAKRASDSVRRALTMHIDLDESIGALTFVKSLMPESALVFLNVSGEHALARPVEGAVAHPWTNLQPWLMFKCPEASPVFAVAAGTVTAVSPLSEGRFGVLVDHGEGRESVYASLSDAALKAGDTVERGQQLGATNGSLYFEYRQSGESEDPTEAMGL